MDERDIKITLYYETEHKPCFLFFASLEFCGDWKVYWTAILSCRTLDNEPKTDASVSLGYTFTIFYVLLISCACGNFAMIVLPLWSIIHRACRTAIYSTHNYQRVTQKKIQIFIVVQLQSSSEQTALKLMQH